VGNKIGTDITGTESLGVYHSGILVVSASNTIGGTASGASNLIAGFGNPGGGATDVSTGIWLDSSGATSNLIEGNLIGTNVTGKAILNSSTHPGIYVAYGAQGNTIGGTAAGTGNTVDGFGQGMFITQSATGNVVERNKIGTDETGTVALGNTNQGILITLATSNTIGGTAAGAGNVISGNLDGGVDDDAGGNLYEGNFIGANAAGTAALPNTGDGIDANGSGSTIGGSTCGASNLISGNTGNGVGITGADNLVEGNLIGTDITGTVAIANGGDGVDVSGGASGNWIGVNPVGGSETALQRNVISGNTSAGVEISDSGMTGNTVAGDYIGADYTGSHAISNYAGVKFDSGATGNLIGTNGDGVSDALERNILSGNAFAGVWITGTGTDQNVVAGNYIGSTASGSSALGNGSSYVSISSAYSIGGGIVIENGASNNLIGTSGQSADDAGERNIISGNVGDGIDMYLTGNSDNVVAGNYIGVNPTGTAKVANGGDGLFLAEASAKWVGVNAVYGPENADEGNVISGNDFYGIEITDSTAAIVAGNDIGTNAAGTAAIANLYGVGIDETSSANLVGTTGQDGANDAIERNVISGNTNAGIILGTIDSGGINNGPPSANVVAGNYIGTTAAGTGALGNGADGVEVSNGASGNWIGFNSVYGPGTTDDRNVILGNSADGVGLTGAGTTGNVVAGNYVGTNAAGTAAVGNRASGVALYAGASGNTIGGTAAGAGNVLSGNRNIGGSRGILINGAGTDSNVVIGNFIGTNAAGTAAVPNDDAGILLYGGAQNNTIGGAAAADRNVISANTTAGVEITGASATGNLVLGEYTGTNAAGTAALPNSGDGVLVGGAVSGNWIGVNPVSGPESALQGDVISGNTSDGVEITGAGTAGNAAAGNYIGTDYTGTHAIANHAGIEIDSAATGNLIGTNGDGVADALERNIVSGNSLVGVWITGAGTDSNVVAGNYVGTNASGSGAIPNGTAPVARPATDLTAVGVAIEAGASDNRVGTNATDADPAGERNLISGNNDDGVEIGGSGSSGNLVAGNYIGLAASGTAALGNYQAGLLLFTGATGNTVGGLTAALRNVMGGNGNRGIYIFTSPGSSTPTTANVISGNGPGGPGITNTANIVLYYSSGSAVQSNYVGADVTGTVAISNNTYNMYVGGGSSITIGGFTPTPGTGLGNVISGKNAEFGLGIAGNTGPVVVEGNIVGADATGEHELPNAALGVYLDQASGVTIGGAAAGAGNLISGDNRPGNEGNIFLDQSSNNAIQGNLIGTDLSGTAALGNGVDGVELDTGASGNTIGSTAAGAGNMIADNTADGVQVVGTGTTGNAIRGNSIFGNTVLGIELGTSGVPSTNVLGGSTSGPNYNENYPVLTIVSYTPGIGTTIAGNINTRPNTTVDVDLYTDPVEGLDGYGQGQTYLGSVTVSTTSDGNASFTYLSTSLPRNAIVTATATDPGNTSEFSLDAAEDTPPIAALVARPSPAGSPATNFNEGQTITFDGSGSYSPDGDALSYTWDFNDGTSPVTTATPIETHTYHYDGTYVVTLIVNDGHGGIESTIDIVKINKLPPMISLNPLPASVAVGATRNLSGTIDDPTPDLETVVLNWGDGSRPTTLHLPAGSTTFAASHDYASPLAGGATTATVTDASNPAASPQPSPIGPLTPTPTFDVGGLSGSTSATLTVFQQTPTVAGLILNQSTVNVGGTITLSGTIVDPNPLVSHTVTIQWCDASAATTLILPPGDMAFASSHTYESTPGDALTGAYPIELTVVISNLVGGGAVAPPAITVVDVSPVVQIESLPLSSTGSLVSLLASASEPGTLNQLTYQWTISANGSLYATGTGQTLSFDSISGGVYTVGGVVTDQDGAAGQATAQVVVGPATANNTVIFSPAGAGLVTLTANGTTSTPFAPGNGIIYYARGATNFVEAAPNLTTPIELVGSTGGTNTLIGGAGNDTLVSVHGDDYLAGTTGNTVFVLILGHDPTLVAATGINTIDLSQTPQNITFNLGSQTVQTVDSAGDAVLLKGTFQNVIAGPGNDILTAANGVNSSLIGGSGNDIIFGTSSGNDSIVGGTGNATIVGGGSNDIIFGTSSGNDSIVGGTGNATINGGGGKCHDHRRRRQRHHLRRPRQRLDRRRHGL